MGIDTVIFAMRNTAAIPNIHDGITEIWNNGRTKENVPRMMLLVNVNKQIAIISSEVVIHVFILAFPTYRIKFLKLLPSMKKIIAAGTLPNINGKWLMNFRGTYQQVTCAILIHETTKIIIIIIL